jgi:hypothetical protein
MATCAEGDEIVFAVLARMASEFLVMNFEVHPRSAELAAPTIAPQHSLSQPLGTNLDGLGDAWIQDPRMRATSSPAAQLCKSFVVSADAIIEGN